MSFSIVIPVLNEVNYLPALLDDITSQDTKPDEVIVGDCGSNDGTLEMLKAKYPNVLLASSKLKNPGAARNSGAQMVNTEQIIFIDADIRIPHNFCGDLIRSHKTVNADITYPKFLNDGKSIKGALHLKLIRIWIWYWRHSKPDKGMGGLICVNTKVHKSLGGFDESMVKGEDVKYFVMASRRGLNINYSKNVSCNVSSRRIRGMGLTGVLFDDGFLSKLVHKKPKRDYEGYK